MKFLELRHDFELSAMASGTLLAPLLRHYGAIPRVRGLAKKVSVAVHLESGAHEGAAWVQAPRYGRPGHIKAMSALSVAMQRAMRAWTSLAWCGDMELLRDRERTAVVAVYLALRPYVSKLKNDWTYDPLAVTTDVLARQAAAGLRPQLERLEAICLLEGEAELAAYYAPKNAEWLLDSVLRSPRMLWELFDRENKLIRVWAPLLGHEPDEERFAAAREQCAAALWPVLRRSLDWRYLAPIAEIEAAAAVEAFCQLAGERKLSVAIDPLRDECSRRDNVIVFPRRAA